ncbi:MAG: aldo/keto reductase [Spirochaetia bacterium]|nr:aldo/keto reductase [Spirochaetia bacterium]
MQQRKLGKNGPTVSALGLGCMGMSTFYVDEKNRDEAESIATIHAALDAGITFLNTGDFYGMGHNEMLIARALKERSEKPTISVKFGAMRSPSGAFVGFDARPAAVKNFASYSLQRLGVEVIDIYQPSRVDPGVPFEETIGAVKDLIVEGKVRYLGISEANPEQIRRANAVHEVAALEIEYSIATRFIEKEILKTTTELGISVVAYGALSRGLLTKKHAGGFSKGDFRSHLPRFQGANLKNNEERIYVLESIAKQKECSTAQLAFAWLLSRDESIIPLVGTSNRVRLAENLKSLEVKLSEADIAELDRSFPEGAFLGERYPEQQMGMVPK